MSFLSPSRWSRQRDELPPPPPPLSSLDEIRRTTAALKRMREARDLAIARGREQHTQRELAAAAGLSVARIKQLSSAGAAGNGTNRDPVTEVDLRLPAPLGDGDRIYALQEVDPWLPSWGSERAFLLADPRRSDSERPDISTGLYDLDPQERWIAAWVSQTREIYTFPHVPPALPEQDLPDGPGSTSGPCYLLGHAASYAIVDAAMNTPAGVVDGRIGGVAWLYGRIRLINAVLQAAADPIEDLIEMPERIWKYLQDLPESERPRAPR